MEYSIKVFLVNPYWTEAKALMESLANVEDIELVGEANKVDSVLIKVNELQPDVVLIDAGMQEDQYTLAEEITAQFINTAVIIIGETPGDDYYRRMLQAGVRDFVKKPVEPPVLVEAIYAAYENEKRKRVVAPVENVEEKGSRRTKVITVFSSKGGAGKTTVSVNLAACIAKNFLKRTILWDLDLHHGVVSVATNITQRRHITDMLNEVQYLDEELLESYLERHESGLKVLPAPFTPEFADFVSAEHVNKILEVAKENFEYIVVDNPSYFSEPTIEIMKHSDLILLVGALDMGTIKNLKACLMVLSKLNFSLARVKLVLNRVGKEYGISPKDLENTLNMPVFATIPAEAKSVITSLNQGVPAVLNFPDSEFGRSIHSLTKSVLGNKKSQQPQVKKKGLLWRLTSKTSEAGG